MVDICNRTPGGRLLRMRPTILAELAGSTDKQQDINDRRLQHQLRAA